MDGRIRCRQHELSRCSGDSVGSSSRAELGECNRRTILQLQRSFHDEAIVLLSVAVIEGVQSPLSVKRNDCLV